MLTEQQRQIIEDRVWGFSVYWYAIDEEGYVGQFAIAGDGAVPLESLSLIDEYDGLLTYLIGDDCA